MSELKVNILAASNVYSNTITLGSNSSVNSSGIFLGSANGVINTSSIRVTSGANNVTIQSVMSLPSINIAGTVVTSVTDETVNTQIFSANGFWRKPTWATTGNELIVVHAWGGGGGGNSSGFGGGGGAFVFGYMKGSQANQTVNATGTWCNVIVGLGGTGGVDGGTSSFYLTSTKILNAYGGAGGGSTGAGCGGGWFSVGTRGQGGGPLGGTASSNIPDSTFGGAAVNSTAVGVTIYGGGGGTGSQTGATTIFGGAGGKNTSAVSTSVYGGFGANSSVAATTPGGGGAGSATNISGARGEIRVYTFRIM